MNVLFVTYDFPYPITSGGKNRAFHLLKYTAKKANIFLYSFVRDDYNPESNEEILKLGVKDIKVYNRKKLTSPKSLMGMIIHNSSIFKSLYYEKAVLDDIREIVKEKDIDIVHFESSYTGFYIGKKFKATNVKTVLGTENIEFRLYFDYAKSSKNYLTRPFAYYQALKLRREELNMIKKSDAVTVITNEEKEFLKTIAGVDSQIVANGIEPSNFSFETHTKIENNILFVGNFDYFPNVEAIKFFVKEVFPHLSKDITLTVVGKNAGKTIKSDDKRLVTKEFVEDIIPEYRKADCMIFPIKVGGGTNFKVLEAMSLGTPIVAEPKRLEGLNAIPDEHFLEATTPNTYISQIERIYKDSQLRHTLTKNARDLIDKNYSWDKIGDDLYMVWKNLK